MQDGRRRCLEWVVWMHVVGVVFETFCCYFFIITTTIITIILIVIITIRQRYVFGVFSFLLSEKKNICILLLIHEYK